jgi:hypothetical protein
MSNADIIREWRSDVANNGDAADRRVVITHLEPAVPGIDLRAIDKVTLIEWRDAGRAEAEFSSQLAAASAITAEETTPGTIQWAVKQVTPAERLIHSFHASASRLKATWDAWPEGTITRTLLTHLSELGPDPDSIIDPELPAWLWRLELRLRQMDSDGVLLTLAAKVLPLVEELDEACGEAPRDNPEKLLGETFAHREWAANIRERAQFLSAFTAIDAANATAAGVSGAVKELLAKPTLPAGVRVILTSPFFSRLPQEPAFYDPAYSKRVTINLWGGRGRSAGEIARELTEVLDAMALWVAPRQQSAAVSGSALPPSVAADIAQLEQAIAQLKAAVAAGGEPYRVQIKVVPSDEFPDWSFYAP